VTFELRRLGLAVDPGGPGAEAVVFSAKAPTGADGVARLDLKARPEAGTVVGLAVSPRFHARFAGDATHCGATAEAPFDLLAAPVVAVPSPDPQDALAVAREVVEVLPDDPVGDGVGATPVPPGVQADLERLSADLSRLVEQLRVADATQTVGETFGPAVATVLAPAAERLLAVVRSVIGPVPAATG